MSYKEEFAKSFLRNLKVIGKEEEVNTNLSLVNRDTGEEEIVLGKSYRKVFVDNDQFIKVFKNYVRLRDEVKKLSKMAIWLLFWIMENLPKNRIDIFLNPKDLLTEYGSDGKSLAMVYKAIKELEASNILKPTEKTNLYEINPSVLFNGNRVEFVTTIITEKVTPDGWKITEYKEMKAKKK